MLGVSGLLPHFSGQSHIGPVAQEESLGSGLSHSSVHPTFNYPHYWTNSAAYATEDVHTKARSSVEN